MDTKRILELLRDSHDLLDQHLGDSNLTDFESEEEEREYAPAQVAAAQIMQVIQLMEAQPEDRCR